MKHLTYIAFLFALVSCEQKTDWDIHEGEPFLVADCIITNELKNHEFHLYRSSAEMNHAPEGYPGAIVKLYDGSSTIIFTEDPVIPGRYVSALPFIGTAGLQYSMVVLYEGHSDKALASMAGVAPLEELRTVASDEYFRYIFNQAVPAYMLEVYYDWSGNPAYCEQYGSCDASEVFYSLHNIDVGKIFAPDKQIIRFPHSTRIIRRKYSLNEDHQAFIRSLLLETEWRGGFFDTEQGNVPTNFRHGLRGWFAACTVVSDTTYFE
jgi:hypothetical protein